MVVRCVVVNGGGKSRPIRVLYLYVHAPGGVVGAVDPMKIQPHQTAGHDYCPAVRPMSIVEAPRAPRLFPRLSAPLPVTVRFETVLAPLSLDLQST